MSVGDWKGDGGQQGGTYRCINGRRGFGPGIRLGGETRTRERVDYIPSRDFEEGHESAD